jgi:lipooligosaccharide transport system permease protein
VAIERALILGEPSWSLLGHAAYLAVMGWAGLRLASRRLGYLLNP